MFRHLVAVLLLGAAIVTVQPVAAYEPLTIISLQCESLGGGRATCRAEVTGGTGSYTYTWTKRQAGTTYTTTLSSTTSTTFHGCSIGKSYFVTVTVRDSAGATAVDDSGSYTCTKEAQ
jgi:hypothetical protein